MHLTPEKVNFKIFNFHFQIIFPGAAILNKCDVLWVAYCYKT